MEKTVGTILRLAREAMGLTQLDVVKKTHIRLNYLQELENDHPELLPSPVQARGFLRLYAQVVNLSPDDLISQWENEVSAATIPDESADGNEEDKIAGVKKGFAPLFLRHEEEEPESSVKKVDRDKAEEKPFFEKLQDYIRKAIPGKLKKRQTKSEDLKTEETVESIQESETIQLSMQDLTAEELFDKISLSLIQRRKALDLTLSDVERYTNVKRMYLEAMENRKFEMLPSTVQGRGMLNNYIQFLGMDDENVMDLYAMALQKMREEHLQGQKRARQPAVSLRVNIPPALRRILNPDLIIGGVIIIGIFSFILWGAAQVFGGAEPTPTEVPSISEVLAQTPTPTPADTDLTPTSKEETVTPIPGVVVAESTPTPIATVNAAPLQLYIITYDRAYLRVVVDSVEVFNGRVVPEDVFTFSGNTQIDLLTGNGNALEVYFNQDYLGDLGEVGEVVDISFTLDGLQKPTPEAEPTEVDSMMMEEPDLGADTLGDGQ